MCPLPLYASRKLFNIAIFLLLSLLWFVPLGHAETRWCQVTGNAPSDKIVYPPIARAARVSGPVMGRITFTPAGRVTNLEVIRGPVMLARSASEQFKSWTFQTTARGEEPCMTLVILEFSLGYFPRIPPQPQSPSVLRLFIEAEPLILSDPAATTTRRKHRFWPW